MGPDYFGAARYLSWATITLQPNNSTLTDIIDVRPGNYTTSSLDGSFQVWVPEGTYGMGVALEGYADVFNYDCRPAGLGHVHGNLDGQLPTLKSAYLARYLKLYE